MYALVKDKKIVKTTNESSFEWDGYTFSNVYLLSPTERLSYGIYDVNFISVQASPTQKIIGSTFTLKKDCVEEKQSVYDKTIEELDREKQQYRESLVVTPWQIRKALNAANLRTLVENAVTLSTDIVIKDGWEFAQEFKRLDPFVVNLGTSLGKTEEEMDQLFKLAKTL